ncbi:hypothetical protein, partial [Nocardia sp. NPDC049707]|uniref:hypothetical protein n=1 Tax=Nocardia sp. NPDC049707 TaxID=3154735 RepID=UPI0034205FEB
AERLRREEEDRARREAERLRREEEDRARREAERLRREEEDRARREAERPRGRLRRLREVFGFGREESPPPTRAPEPELAPPLRSRGRPEPQRKYTKDDFIKMWERRIGRPITPAELKTIDRGCIGLTVARLGRVEGNPQLNLAFDDPVAQQAIAKAEKVLAPGEVANQRAADAAKQLKQAQQELAEARKKPGATEDSRDVRLARDQVALREKQAKRYQEDAKKAWSKISDEYKREMQTARREAKIEGGKRTFEKVSGYADKFNAILESRPASRREFMRLVKADKDLAQLKDVERWLPDGDPSEWEVVIYSKHFWSGGSSETPNPARFAPDPTTGQVDMSGATYVGKPGFVNFDYGWYDPQSGSWWHANHMEYPDPVRRANSPMEVYQSSPTKFFSSYMDFDSSVIAIGFVRRPQ